MRLEICGESKVPYPFYPDFPTISNGATLHYLRNDARPAVIIQEAGYENSNRKRGGSIRRIRFEIPDSIVWQNLCDPYSILSPFFSPLYRHISRFLSSLPDPRHLQTASPKSVSNRSIQILSSLLVLTDLKDLYIVVSKIQTNFVPNIALRRRNQGTRYRW